MGPMSPKSRRLNWNEIAAIALVFFSFAMSAILSRDVFERMPHLEDEVAYLFQARVFAAGEISVDTPDPRRPFWQPFVVDYAPTGQRFGKYTPGWPAMLAMGVSAGQPWIVNALLAALATALVYRLGRAIYGRDAGLIAAALLAFSPAALLLNASLMGHTAALVLALGFVYACWRMERGQNRLRWGLIAGGVLGLLIITRPLTAIGVAMPLVAWAGGRLLWALLQRRGFALRLYPLLLLSAVALLIGAAIPLFSAATTGDPTQNLYTLVWDYDRIGFGECCGRNGHTLEKAVRHTRFDLSLTAADLFGWQIGAIDAEVEDHWLTQSDYFPNTGLSFLLLPFGAAVGLVWAVRDRAALRRRLSLFVIWMLVAAIWVQVPLALSPEMRTDPLVGWAWLAVSLIWLLGPLLAMGSAGVRVRWTWVLVGLLLGIVLVQMTYWIGSQRYSTRYYYEALGAAAVLSALPLAWLARRGNGRGRWIVYPLLSLLLLWSFVSYSLPRVQVLHRFNNIGLDDLALVEELRRGDQPVLVLISGPDTGEDRVRWRALGSFMAVTSPFLDSDIVGAWDYDVERSRGLREQIMAQFPDRQVIELQGRGDEVSLKD